MNDLKRLSKIVLIDDEPASFPIELLQEEGYSIEHWHSVKNMRRLEEGEFDIIILDIAGVAEKWSRTEDGLGVLEHLKQHNKNQVVVAFSGQSFDLSKQRFFDMADDVLCKPVEAVKCKQVIDELLKTHFTVAHLWNALQTILDNSDVNRSTIDKIEQLIIGAVKTKDTSTTAKKIQDLTPQIKAFGLVLGCIEKIVKIASVV